MSEAFIKLDYRCNQRCLFCCTADDKESLSYAQAKEIVHKYAIEMNYPMISFTGGEPCVVSYIPKIINFAKGLDKKVKIQTNAIALHDKDYAKTLVDSGLDLALVSIHSYKNKINDKLTQVEGSLSKSLGGIQNLIDLGVEVQLAYVITKENKDISSFVEAIAKHFPEIKHIQFFVPWAISRGWQSRSLVPKFSEINEKLREGFDKCSDNNIKFVTRGIPICHLGKYWKNSTETNALLNEKPAMIINDFGDDKPRHSFEESNCKEPQCKFCVMNDKCGGVWNTYPKIYPYDLWPIYDKINNVENLGELDG